MLKNIVERVIPELTEDVLEMVSKRVLTVGVGASLEPSFRPQYCSIIRALLRKKRAVALAMEERLRLAPVQLPSCILLNYAHAAVKTKGALPTYNGDVDFSYYEDVTPSYYEDVDFSYYENRCCGPVFKRYNILPAHPRVQGCRESGEAWGTPGVRRPWRICSSGRTRCPDGRFLRTSPGPEKHR